MMHASTKQWKRARQNGGGTTVLYFAQSIPVVVMTVFEMVIFPYQARAQIQQGRSRISEPQRGSSRTSEPLPLVGLSSAAERRGCTQKNFASKQEERGRRSGAAVALTSLFGL